MTKDFFNVLYNLEDSILLKILTQSYEHYDLLKFYSIAELSVVKDNNVILVVFNEDFTFIKVATLYKRLYFYASTNKHSLFFEHELEPSILVKKLREYKISLI